MSHTVLTICALLLYLGLGCLVGMALHQKGFRNGTTASALLIWPMLLGLLSDAPQRESAPAGPYRRQIDEAFAALMATLQDPVAGASDWNDDVNPLRTALIQADVRIAFVDRLLMAGKSPTHDKLASARATAAHEVEEVLVGVIELRLQVGLLALAGNAVAVRDQLQTFHARAQALAEVTDIATG